MKQIFALSSLLILFYSCSKNDEKNAIEKTILDFPFLKPKNNETYILQRKIDLDSIKLSLFQSTDCKDNQIITIENKGKFYSIPLLSNIYRDYWNFPNDSTYKNIPKVNTTFEKEYIKGMKQLNLYNANDFFSVNREILQSLLHCRTNIETDSLKFYDKINNVYTNEVNPENINDCLQRTISNFKLISLDAKNQFKDVQYYYDEYRDRIYRLENTENRENYPKINIKIKSFRQDCITESLTL